MAKRLIDLTISALALLALAPLLALVALLIRLDSPGPALFRQVRLGKDGRPFTMLKFRTMRHGADDRSHREAIERAASGARSLASSGRRVFKSNDDPRITRLGRFLRASGADELPQLINVLRGEMSLVGPRPALAYELAHYRGWHHGRFAVRPGITGLWQVRRVHAQSLDEMLRMDVEYCTTRTLWGDLKLIALTVPAIVRERGAF